MVSSFLSEFGVYVFCCYLKLLQYFIEKYFLILSVQGYNSEQFLSKHELLWHKKLKYMYFNWVSS